MAKRQEVFVQFLYKGSEETVAEVADRIANEILTGYDVDAVSVAVESLDEDAN